MFRYQYAIFRVYNIQYAEFRTDCQCQTYLQSSSVRSRTRHRLTRTLYVPKVSVQVGTDCVYGETCMYRVIKKCLCT
jgi:hypothetical protein